MIVKERLAFLSMCYSVTLMEVNGREYCVSASEERDGKVVLVDTETKEVAEIAGLAGGVMAVVPIPEENGGFLAIQKFYPVFDSAAAEVVHGTLCLKKEETAEGKLPETVGAKVGLVARIPYVHRIGLAGEAGRRRMIAATLCKSKRFVEDWSQPGYVYEYTLDGDFQVTKTETLLEGITKNHGMYTYEKRGGAYTLISGEEGVWAIDGKSQIQKLCEEPVSDLCLYDIDGDGVDEMVCIAPFHGDHLRVFKKTAGGWECLADEGITFGHAVWCGACKGAPLILCCSRGGDKCSRAYRPVWEEGKLGFETMDVDEGVGASNIHVKEAEGAVVFYAANHEVGEVARYTIEG